MFDQDLMERQNELIGLASDLLLRNRISHPIFKSLYTDITSNHNASELEQIGSHLAALAV